MFGKFNERTYRGMSADHLKETGEILSELKAEIGFTAAEETAIDEAVMCVEEIARRARDGRIIDWD